jgi:hypothetical protein
MPVNILATFILGSALAWIVIKITRPPKHLEGLILGCCSAGIFILYTNILHFFIGKCRYIVFSLSSEFEHWVKFW